MLTAVDATAEGMGLAPGMSLADARTLVPDVAVRPDERQKTAMFLARLADWCGRYTPWTAVDGEDGVWLDTAGCAHLFGGEEAMLSELLARVAGFGLSARAALAPTPGAAWALARFANGACILDETEIRERLAGLPVAALRLEPEHAVALNRLGLRRITDLYPLPRAPFAARFGEDTARRLDQALGRLAEPISPRRPVAPFRSRLAFAEAIGHADDIARGLDRLLADLSEHLACPDRGCRRLELTLFRVDGSLQQAAVGTARASRDPRHLARLFAEQLTAVDPEFGIEAMVLAAPVTEKLVPDQAEIISNAEAPPEAMAALLDRLGNRLGFGRLHVLQPTESHLPERAQRSVAAQNIERIDGRRKQKTWLQSQGRPLRLLRDPEPMVAMTPEEEDGTPPAVFRWRRRLYQLRRLDGPERIAPEWWREDGNWAGGARDYWRIEDAGGRRLWLYRESGRAGESRWFVHGVSA